VKRRKALRGRSSRRRSFEDELDAITPALSARSRGVCEICGAGVAIVRHHRLRRSQGGLNDLSNLLHLCRDCHDTVHGYPALSYDRGWLLRRPPRAATFVVGP